MKIIFRVHVHTESEILVGHKLGFSGLQGVDAVSATANPEGFTHSLRPPAFMGGIAS